MVFFPEHLGCQNHKMMHVTKGQIGRLALSDLSVSCGPGIDWRLGPLVPRNLVPGMANPFGQVGGEPCSPFPGQSKSALGPQRAAVRDNHQLIPSSSSTSFLIPRRNLI
jgi:hypothetical protein